MKTIKAEWNRGTLSPKGWGRAYFEIISREDPLEDMLRQVDELLEPKGLELLVAKDSDERSLCVRIVKLKKEGR